MKILRNLLVVLFAVAISTSVSTAQKSKSKFTEITIKTSSECGMCKDRIEKAMAYTKGVKSSDLDIKAKELTVKYNPKKTTPEKIRKAVSDVGYDADKVPANAEAYEKLPACCQKGGHD